MRPADVEPRRAAQAAPAQLPDHLEGQPGAHAVAVQGVRLVRGGRHLVGDLGDRESGRLGDAALPAGKLNGDHGESGESGDRGERAQEPGVGAGSSSRVRQTEQGAYGAGIHGVRILRRRG